LKNFYVLDERKIWHKAACEAARNHGYSAHHIRAGREVGSEGGVGFIRPHADWRQLPTNRLDFRTMRERGLTMIQDEAQVDLYEDKSGQFARWGAWMPDTWRFTDQAAALTFLDGAAFPLVSKADVGASSVNVRILYTLDQAAAHVRQLFGRGIPVNHGAHCPDTLQKGYALLQRFIPHTTTWRVNAIGDARAVFKRYCYKDRPVAQTGNVDPTYEMSAELESLLDFSDRFFAHAGTKWCAIDVLKDGDAWKLLETSLAWPWPSPGDCNNGTIFRSRHKWIGMFEAMFDEVERGAWAGQAASAVPA
jgi:hypothetical protein